MGSSSVTKVEIAFLLLPVYKVGVPPHRVPGLHVGQGNHRGDQVLVKLGVDVQDPAREVSGERTSEMTTVGGRESGLFFSPISRLILSSRAPFLLQRPEHHRGRGLLEQRQDPHCPVPRAGRGEGGPPLEGPEEAAVLVHGGVAAAADHEGVVGLPAAGQD